MVLSSFVFLDETSTSLTSNPLPVINANQLTLEVAPTVQNGPVAVTIQGRTDTDAQDNFTPIAVIDAKTLKVVESIVSAGNYLVPVSGMASVRVVNTGTVSTVKVLGRLVQ